MIKYVILNGPPRVGKSIIAAEIQRTLTRRLSTAEAKRDTVVVDSFAAPIKHFIAAALAEKYQHMDKEKARPELNGFSARQALINLSENHCKVVYGEDIFGRWLVHRSLKNPQRHPTHVIVDDGGFVPEIAAVPNRFVVAVQRHNHTFADDSRNWYPKPDWLLKNEGDLSDMWKSVNALVEHLVTT